jgi:uracil-DNA glycosylase family 4
VTFRQEARASEPAWFNSPVPTWRAAEPVRLLVVGLAPGLRGANRTGRPFTGDYAGVLLYETLVAHGFARGTYGAKPDDGLELRGCAITNAVRCVPPQNKPTPAEITTCRRFLVATLSAYPDLHAIVALGRIAHESVLRTFGLRLTTAPFGHGRAHKLPGGSLLPQDVTLFDSYHCSRYNTNTGVLTPAMFETVFAAVRRDCDAA